MADPARVAVLLSGRGSNLRALVEGAQGYRVVLVASDKPDAGGLAWAAEQGIATFALSPRGIGKQTYEEALDAALCQAGVQVIALAGYMRLLSDAFVDRWRGRMINIHPSLLPKYKGLDTHARAIAAGDAVAGCSVHLVTEELDGGELLGQAEVPIEPGDTPDSLAARVLVAEHQLYPRVLSEFSRAMTDHPALPRLRDLAHALPGTEERPSHGQPTFFVEGKMFAQFRDDHHGDGRTVVAVKASSPDEASMLIEAAPDLYSKVAYFRAEWVGLNLVDPDWQLVEDRVAQSWELAAPKALLEAGGR
jgi:phosphoribosylglycinamide formyltransferase-1